ncbi:FAR-17a/AIG1-like protein [Mycena sp. CBHHK59/15]|nr:FAR-17a/AIG1-like protein [Mycena sp. CBHHK59/15]
MVRISSALLHVNAICVMTYGYKALNGLSINTWIESQYGGHFQFLTIQGLAVAWLTMFIGLVEDFFPSIYGVRVVKRSLFIIAMPTETIISSIYWTLLLTFPHLILQGMPSESASTSVIQRIPLRMDLALHAAPALALLADFMIFERRYRKADILYVAPVLTFLCTMWYGWWAEHCASINGTFPYPFLTQNPLEIRLRIYAGAGTVAFLSFYALNILHPSSY